MSEHSEEKFMWGHEATCELIQLYKRHPVLYASFNSDYKNKGKRLDALNAIRSELVRRGRNISIEDIKRKIHGLRTQYANQLSKMKKNVEVKPTLWCFNQLDFLRNSYEGQHEPDNDNIHESKDLGHYNVYEHDDSQEVASFYDDINVKQEVTPTNGMVETSVFVPVSDIKKRERTEDDLSTFGKLVELELRKITNRQLLRKAKKEIISVLMDAQDDSDI